MGRAQRLRARTQSELNSLHNKTNKAVEEEEWRWQLQELIQNKDVDVIRKLAFKGFINRRFRKEIWPLLLNVKPSDRYNWDSRRHKKYGDIIDKDVNRSFNRIEVATTVPERIQCSLRNQLRDLLNGVLNKDEELHYVQGLHDIFSVILFECGEKLAYPIALELCRGKIKEFTRDSLQVTIMALDLLFPLVRKLDEKVEKFLVNSSVRPFFALSWFITWFSHDILNNQVVLHFFDFFLASHPLMPLYMCAIVNSIFCLFYRLFRSLLYESLDSIALQGWTTLTRMRIF